MSWLSRYPFQLLCSVLSKIKNKQQIYSLVCGAIETNAQFEKILSDTTHQNVGRVIYYSTAFFFLLSLSAHFSYRRMFYSNCALFVLYFLQSDNKDFCRHKLTNPIGILSYTSSLTSVILARLRLALNHVNKR